MSGDGSLILETRPNRVIESLHEVGVHRLPIDPFAGCVGNDRYELLDNELSATAEALAERVVVTVNSTAIGGGVAEMLPRLLGYERASGIDARWYVLNATESFFRITKRLHHRLHGALGDGGELGDAERRTYEGVIESGVQAVTRVVRAGDIVHLHDPQVVGLAPTLAAAGAKVIWQLHIGADCINESSDEAWSFLAPYLEGVSTFVFSRSAYAPPQLEGRDVRVIAPSVDPFSVKNMPLDDPIAVLCQAGIVAGSVPSNGRARVVTEGLPSAGERLVLQVSRWDPLKGMVELVDAAPSMALRAHGAHLLLVGPDVESVDDDPEGRDVLAACRARWAALPDDVRARVHLVSLPM
ncbi:MAG: trehalose synthase, partial [Actinomycetota bacterium]